MESENILSYDDLFEELQNEKIKSNKLLQAAKAYQMLSAFYRIGKRPTEKLFDQLEKADKLLKEMETKT